MKSFNEYFKQRFFENVDDSSGAKPIVGQKYTLNRYPGIWVCTKAPVDFSTESVAIFKKLDKEGNIRQELIPRWGKQPKHNPKTAVSASLNVGGVWGDKIRMIHLVK
jgi:hypothetical protein